MKTLASWCLVVAACGGGGKAEQAPDQGATKATAAPAVVPVVVDATAAAPTSAGGFASYADALAAGRKLSKAGDFPAAKAAFEAALVLNHEDSVALSELGFVELKLGRLEAALAKTDRSITAASDANLKAASLYNRGRILEKQGDVAGARTSYEESLALRPNDVVQARLALLDEGLTGGMDTPPGVAELTQRHAKVRAVPWDTLTYGCGSGCKASVHKVIYGDVDGDGNDEAVVVVQGAIEGPDGHTASLYGVRDGAVAWLGRVHAGGLEHPEFAPRFVKAKISRGKVAITWHFLLWGNFDDPEDGSETVTETYRLEDGEVVAD